MYCNFEVLDVREEIVNWPAKNGRPASEVHFVQLSGLDTDYMDVIVKIKVRDAKNPDELKRLVDRGDRFQVTFKMTKDDKWNKCIEINLTEEQLRKCVAAGVSRAQVQQPVQAHQPVMAKAA